MLLLLQPQHEDPNLLPLWAQWPAKGRPLGAVKRVTILNHELEDMQLPIQIIQKKDWQAATIGHLLVAHCCCYS